MYEISVDKVVIKAYIIIEVYDNVRILYKNGSVLNESGACGKFNHSSL